MGFDFLSVLIVLFLKINSKLIKTFKPSSRVSDHYSRESRHLRCPHHGAECPRERAAAVGGPDLQLHLHQRRVQAAGHQVVF